MRNELEYLQLIDKYLKGELTGEQKADFEARLQNSEQLQNDVQLQKDIMDGIKQHNVKAEIKSAQKSFKFKAKLKTIGITVAVATGLAVGSYFAYNVLKSSDGKPSTKTEISVAEETGAGVFQVDTKEDQIIETDNGSIYVIPADAFEYEDGTPVEGPVDVMIEEALAASDIIEKGLSTMSGDDLLESGGMFKVEAEKDGKPLKLKDGKEIYAEIPTDQVKEGMQLYDGVEGEDGQVDWVDPKPLVKDLTPVDINSLNFYPPQYLDSLAGMGYNVGDKPFTDSLYYSFASEFANFEDFSNNQVINGRELFMKNCNTCHDPLKHRTGPPLAGAKARWQTQAPGMIYEWVRNNKEAANKSEYALERSVLTPSAMNPFPQLSNAEIDAILKYVDEPWNFGAAVAPASLDSTGIDSVGFRFSDAIPTGAVSDNMTYSIYRNGDDPEADDYRRDTIWSISGINPARIKAIWNPEFNNTLLATREFEERLKAIHRTCNQAVLDLYVNNLDKNLWEIDEMVADMGYVEFMDFAMRKDGKVQGSDPLVNKLSEYYKKKTEAFTKAIKQTQQQFWNEQTALDQERNNKERKKTRQDWSRDQQNFQKEYEKNLKEVCKQLGIKKTGGIPEDVYRARFGDLGWKNIDRLVQEATVARESTVIEQDGKTAEIKYEPIEVTMDGEYDKIRSYLIPKDLFSFQRMKENGNTFTEKLNGFLEYDLVVIAYKGDEVFGYKEPSVEPGNYVAKLSPLGADQVDTFIGHKGGRAVSDIKADVAFDKYIIKDDKRMAANRARIRLKERIRPVVFPCSQGEAELAEYEGGYDSEWDGGE